MSQPKPAIVQRRTNLALWIGTLVTLLGIASNTVSLVTLSGQKPLAWLALLLPAIGMALLLLGLMRAFRKREVYGGRISGSIIAAVALPLFALATFGFFHARALPVPSHAPQVGQKAPDFTLANTSGQTVSLSQLLSNPIDSSTGETPKAVLLVFYRGYW